MHSLQREARVKGNAKETPSFATIFAHPFSSAVDKKGARKLQI